MRPEIPDQLVDRIETTIDETGYNSRGEFIRDAIRRRLNDVGVAPAYSTANPVKESGGVSFGRRISDGSQVEINRCVGSTNRNTLCLGDVGAGKTEGTKEILRREIEAYNDLQVIVIDSVRQYADFVDDYDGAEISITDETTVNPLTIGGEGSDKLDSEAADTAAVDRAMEFFNMYWSVSRGSYQHDTDVGEINLLHKVVAETIADSKSTNATSEETSSIPTITDVRERLLKITEDPKETKFVADDASVEEVDQFVGEATRLLFASTHLSQNGKDSCFNGEMDISLFDTDDQVTYINLASFTEKDIFSLYYNQIVTTLYEQAKATNERVLFVVDDAHLFFEPITNSKPVVEMLQKSRINGVTFHFVLQSGETLENIGLLNEIDSLFPVKQLYRSAMMPEQVADALGMSHSEMEFVQNLSLASGKYLCGIDGWHPLTFSNAD